MQEKFEYLTQALENTSYVTPVYTESWLRSYLSFMDENAKFFNVTIDTEDSFIAALKEVRHFVGDFVGSHSNFEQFSIALAVPG